MKNRGFSLVELVVVVAIIGALSWVILAAMHEQQIKKSLPPQTEEEYCQQYADSYEAPIKCYKYFGVQQIGVRTEGKSTRPVLVPTN